MAFPNRRGTKTRLGVVADDLSGAMDTGLQLGKRGLHTLVSLCGDDLPDAEALVVSTESRASSAEEAVRLVEKAARQMHGRTVYKKIDSTLRGNIGAETTALMKDLGYERAIVAPAFPEQGRIVSEGELFVSGRPLHRTAYAKSLPGPVKSSRVQDILAQRSRYLCSHVELRKVERGPWGLVRALESHITRLIVVDAITREHLDIIARAIVLSQGRWLPCGSAGLAESWAKALSPAEATSPTRPPATGKPVLIIAGSRQRITTTQVRTAASKLDLTVIPFLASGGLENADAIAAQAREHLLVGESVILTSARDTFIQGGEARVADGLARLASALCGECDLAGFVLTGGDIALAVCAAIDATAIQITAEIEPGIPMGILQGGLAEGMPVVTKAGGFGSPQAFIAALNYLQGRPT